MTEDHRLSQRLRRWARTVKRDGVALWFAARHPATPWYARAFGVLVVAYALSPIDLVPDFIPVLGYLDDVLLLPVMIWLAVRLVPAPVLVDCRAQAERWLAGTGRRPVSRAGAVAVVGVWVAAACAAWWAWA